MTATYLASKALAGACRARPNHASERSTFCHTHDRISAQVRPPLYDARPCWSRFLQVDPVPGGCANDYVYVHGDPVNTFDLSGAVNCRKLYVDIQRKWNRLVWKRILQLVRDLRGEAIFHHDKYEGHKKAIRELEHSIQKDVKRFQKNCKDPGGGLIPISPYSPMPGGSRGGVGEFEPVP